MKTKTREFCFAGILAAITAVLAQIVIPIGPVPFHMAVFGAYLCGLLLKPKMAVFSMLAYWLMAFVGLPVLAGFTGGASALFGPTGGYVVGYIAIAFCSSLGAKKPMFLKFCCMILGLLICYLLGTIWFIFVMNTTVSEALWLCVIPFIPADLLKCACAVCLARQIEKRIQLFHTV